MSKERFTEPAYATFHFSDKIWVKCPQCDTPIVIKTKLPQYTIPYPEGHESECYCSSCGFKKNDIIDWYGYLQGLIKTSCYFCGNSIYKITPPTSNAYSHEQIQCKGCKREKEYEIKWYRYRGNKPTDPFFGLELCIQIDIKGNNLWLYNLEHLKYLKEYVSSKIRTSVERHKYSMITNLPQWVKSTKNRETILKKLDKAEQELLKFGT